MLQEDPLIENIVQTAEALTQAIAGLEQPASREQLSDIAVLGSVLKVFLDRYRGRHGKNSG